MITSSGTFPSLPDPIPDPEPRSESDQDRNPLAAIVPAAPLIGRLAPIRFRSLKHGCYLARYTPRNASNHYDGTIRVERLGFFGTTASGDLYNHSGFVLPWKPSPPLFFSEPNPERGVPIFRRSRYRYYLRITQILEGISFASSFTIGFEMHRFNLTSKTWTNEGAFTALMSWTAAPSNFPAGTDYLEGDLKNSSGAIVGRLTMGWVSPYLRRATVEVDRSAASEHPEQNAASLDWQGVFDQVGWQIKAYESDTNLNEPSGEFWSNAELHQKMTALKDSADLDTEWRYHLLAVRRLDATSRGIMYDAGATDSNNIPREGAAVSSHWVIPDQDPPWGSVAGTRFGDAEDPYFRTAVHELGHAMGLRHNTADNGFMNTTGVVASSPGTFPANIQWSFNGEDARKLRHMPDPWVRPGEIPWAPSYSDPISPPDEALDADDVSLVVQPVLLAVPLGAPVRVHYELQNNGDADVPVPENLSLKTEHVYGNVYGPGGTVRTFRSIIRCLEEEPQLVDLAPGDAHGGDATLLRGAQGPLFDAPGLYRVELHVSWDVQGVPVFATGSTSVMVTATQDDEHAVAAATVLAEPDTLLSLAIGGDHLDAGNSAIDRALESDALRSHYQVIKAKRAGSRYGPNEALKQLDAHTVLSGSEIKRIAGIIEAIPASQRTSDFKEIVGILKARAQDVPTDAAVVAAVDALHQ